MKRNFKKVKTLIIAEAGVNHNGDLETAKASLEKICDIRTEILILENY